MSFCNTICLLLCPFSLPIFAYYQQFVRNVPWSYKYVNFKFTSVTKSFKVSLSPMFCFSICVHHLNKMLCSSEITGLLESEDHHCWVLNQLLSWIVGFPRIFENFNLCFLYACFSAYVKCLLDAQA